MLAYVIMYLVGGLKIMSDLRRKGIITRVDREMSKQIRIRVAELDTTIQAYIVDLIEKDLKKAAKKKKEAAE